MPDIHVKLKGGCICGEVRYEVDAVTETRQHVLCHCADCRRVTGTETLDDGSINEFYSRVEIWLHAKPAWDNLC